MVAVCTCETCAGAGWVIEKGRAFACPDCVPSGVFPGLPLTRETLAILELDDDTPLHIQVCAKAKNTAF